MMDRADKVYNDGVWCGWNLSGKHRPSEDWMLEDPAGKLMETVRKSGMKLN